jgi:hypothetical protein
MLCPLQSNFFSLNQIMRSRIHIGTLFIFLYYDTISPTNRKTLYSVGIPVSHATTQ